MDVLYFTIFTGVECVPPGTSDLGVTIMIGFGYAMQREGKEEFKEVSFPDMYYSTLRGDSVPSLTWLYIGTESVVTGCLLHYLLLWEQPKLLIALFPMMHVNTHFRQVPAYVEEVWSGFKRGCIEARCPSKYKRDRTRRSYDLFKSTVQVMPGDVDWTNVNALQGKGKIECWWNEVDYEVLHLVSLCTLYRLSWSHSHQRTCTLLLIHLTHSLRHRYLSTRV